MFKHENNTQVSTQTFRHDSAYLILFLTRHSEPIDGDENADLHRLAPRSTQSVKYVSRSIPLLFYIISW